MDAGGGFERNVFINCPFDPSYLPLLQPLLFTLVFLGFTPRIAVERADSAEPRLDRISGLVKECRFGIHDLSRIRAARKGEFYRMNMPFEFGIDYGCRLYGSGRLRTKRCLVLSTQPFEYAKAVSDLAGIDARFHQNQPLELVRQVRNWFLESADALRLPSASMVWYRFSDFISDFHVKRVAEGFSADDLSAMPIREFVGFVAEWNASGSR